MEVKSACSFPDKGNAMKNKIIQAAIEAATIYWQFIGDRSDTAKIIWHEEQGKLKMACLAVGAQTVQSAIENAGLQVPVCVRVAAKN